jgi:hypothetical protein
MPRTAETESDGNSRSSRREGYPCPHLVAATRSRAGAGWGDGTAIAPRAIADAFEARLPACADVAASAAVLVVAAGVDADAVTLGLPFGAGAPGDALAAIADAAGAGIVAGAAVGRIGLQIAAERDRTAVLELGWAIRTDTFAVAAVDGDELARAESVAGAAVIEIGLQIDAAGARA